MNRRSKTTWLGIYFALLLLTLLIAAFVWQERVCGVLYYCSDSLLWELFCPGPFAHLDGAHYGHTGDHYVASEERLEQLRWGLLLAAGIVPALLLWPLDKLSRRHPTPNQSLQRDLSLIKRTRGSATSRKHNRQENNAKQVRQKI